MFLVILFNGKFFVFKSELTLGINAAFVIDETRNWDIFVLGDGNFHWDNPPPSYNCNKFKM